jgi:lambda repressor-like predicted transcriptional regulator
LRVILTKEKLTNYLVKICKEQGLSFRSLSLKAGLSPGTVHSIVFREYEPSIYSLNQLADYLGVERQHLWKLAGLIKDDMNGNSRNQDPRLNYYYDKFVTLPEHAQEMIIRIISDIIDYHVNTHTTKKSS